MSAQNKESKLVIAYDFDGTLARGNMQEYSFFPALNMQSKDFWDEVKKIAKNNDMDEILSYMHLMLKEATYKGISINKSAFQSFGKGIKLFDGVEYWFKRINDYAARKNIYIDHYIISSGIREMILATKISKDIKHIFASGFMYNKDDIAIWPSTAINCTNKTQYLFRIIKGIDNSWDNNTLNEHWDDDNKVLNGNNLIYIGDSINDVPAMKTTMDLGGNAIFVYDAEKSDSKEIVEAIIRLNRANYSCQADYREGSELDKLIKKIIDEKAVPKILP